MAGWARSSLAQPEPLCTLSKETDLLKTTCADSASGGPRASATCVLGSAIGCDVLALVPANKKKLSFQCTHTHTLDSDWMEMRPSALTLNFFPAIE